MLKYYVSFFIFILTLPSAAQESIQLLDTPFSFDNTECTISSVQTLPIDGTKNGSTQIRMKLLFSDKGLPIFEVIFLQHAFKDVSLSWPDVGVQLKERQLFTDDLVPTVRSLENQTIAFKETNDPSTFELSNKNLLTSQAMVALFLAKSSINLSFSALGTSWTLSVSLRGSDEAYRQLASRCFPQESAPYLDLNGSRLTLPDTPSHLTPSAQGVSTGYGLVDFMTLLQLMPVPATWDNFSDPSPVIELLSQKKELLNNIASVTANDDFKASSQEVSALLQTQRTLSERLTVISAPATETSSGLIIQKENEEKALQSELKLLEKKINETQTNLVDLNQRKSANQTDLSPFLDPLTEYEDQSAVMENKVISLSSYKRDIEALLQTYRDQLTSDFFTSNTASPNTVGTPWSLEEIEKQNKDIAPQIRTYRALDLMGEQLTELNSHFSELLAQSQHIDELTAQFLSLQSKKSQFEEKITNNESEIIKMNSMPNIGNLSSIQFAVLLSNSENNVPEGVRSFNVEFDFHKNEFDKLAQSFLQALQSIPGENKWTSLICDWTKLIQSGLRPENLNCLITTDFLNEKTRKVFLETLPPQILDSAIDIPTQPWTLEISKVDYLAQQLSQLLPRLNEPLQPLLELEQRLRILVWRWNVQQKKLVDVDHCQSPVLNEMVTNETFSQSFYELMFTCENNYLQGLITEKDQALTQSLAITVEVSQAENNLRSAENQFIVNSTVFSEAVNSLFSQAKEAVLLENFYKDCVDLSHGIDDCQADFQKQMTFQDQFVKKMLEIDVQIRSRSLLLQQELDKVHQELTQLIEKKNQYIQSNGIEQLLAERDSIKIEINQAQRQLKALADLSSLRQQNLEENAATQLELQQEALQIVAQQTLVGVQIQNIQNSWTIECASFEEARNSLKTIDQELISLMSNSTSTGNMTAMPQAFSLLCQ